MSAFSHITYLYNYLFQVDATILTFTKKQFKINFTINKILKSSIFAPALGAKCEYFATENHAKIYQLDSNDSNRVFSEGGEGSFALSTFHFFFQKLQMAILVVAEHCSLSTFYFPKVKTEQHHHGCLRNMINFAFVSFSNLNFSMHHRIYPSLQIIHVPSSLAFLVPTSTIIQCLLLPSFYSSSTLRVLLL